MRTLTVALIWIFALAGTVLAQDQARAERIVAAWGDWVAANGVSRSSITVSFRGREVTTQAIGTRANDAAPVASLSKAVTAVCINQLFKSGKLQPGTTLGQIFGAEFGDLGIKAPRSGDITIQQLLTHSAGLDRDSTQNDMGGWIGSAKDRHLEVARTALRRKLSGAGRYRYNNENYAILGAVITAVSGQDYGTFCKRTVLSPAGASSARLSSTWGGLGAWGGWEMTTRDYAKFLSLYFGRGSAIGQRPTNYPRVSAGGGAYYGMGTLFRSGGSGYNFWHAGRHCFSKGNAGAFFASWGGDWAVTVVYNRCLKDNVVNKLDNDLATAALR